MKNEISVWAELLRAHARIHAIVAKFSECNEFNATIKIDVRDNNEKWCET